MLIYRIIRKISSVASHQSGQLLTWLKFKMNGVHFSKFRTSGVPYIFVGRGGSISIGKNFAMNNNIKGNPIGCYERCTFFVSDGCNLSIDDNVGISQCGLIAYADIKVLSNVKIGGGSLILTSDFHSLDPAIRASKQDLKYRVCAPVTIKENAFIGTRSIVLKGVTIGANSIIAAGSVVTKSIPDNEIWGGNPAKFIRKINYPDNENSPCPTFSEILGSRDNVCWSG